MPTSGGSHITDITINTAPEGDYGKSSVEDLLVQPLESNETWKDLVAAFNWVMENNVDSPISQLEVIRHITQQSDRQLLKVTARLLGFDSTQDVLDLSSDNLLRLVSQLPRFPEQNSTVYFKNFIDILLNARTEVKYLYTQDYVNFVETPGGPLINEGGTWFKTTHIDLSIALRSYDTLVIQENQTLNSKVNDLFFSYSPITLVIERKNFAVEETTEVRFGAKLGARRAWLIVE